LLAAADLDVKKHVPPAAEYLRRLLTPGKPASHAGMSWGIDIAGQVTWKLLIYLTHVTVNGKITHKKNSTSEWDM
jgi:hypothetical protein